MTYTNQINHFSSTYIYGPLAEFAFLPVNRPLDWLFKLDVHYGVKVGLGISLGLVLIPLYLLTAATAISLYVPMSLLMTVCSLIAQVMDLFSPENEKSPESVSMSA